VVRSLSELAAQLSRAVRCPVAQDAHPQEPVPALPDSNHTDSPQRPARPTRRSASPVESVRSSAGSGA
jgi:hypothetical protein